MSKNDDDPMKKILERRAAIAGDGEELEDDVPEIEDYDPLPEQPSKKKEERAAREAPNSPIKKGPDTPTFDLENALRKQMGNFKIPSVPEKQSKELDREDAWEGEPLEESIPVVREEAPVKKEPGKINVTDGRFDNVAGLFGGGKQKEQPKVGKLKPEAIKALENARAADAERAKTREESPGEPRVSVTSRESVKGPDIPIPPAPPPAPPLKGIGEPRVSAPPLESAKKDSAVPIPPSPPPAPPLDERRTTIAMEESSIPLAERRKTTISEIPAAKGNKYIDIILKNLEQLQQEVSDKIGPKNVKEFADHINKIKDDYNSKSGEEQAQTLHKNLQSLVKWSSEKGHEMANKSIWKKIGIVISCCISFVEAKIAGKETENIKNNLSQAMKELKTEGKKEIKEWVSKIIQEASKNQERSR